MRWVVIAWLVALCGQSLEARDPSDVTPYESLPWMGPDATEQFESQDSSVSQAVSDSVHAVLVPGFFHEWFKGYLDPVRDWLSDSGIDHSTVQTRSDEPSAFNAQKIAQEIEASSKQVLLIAHSRGGVEVLEALIQAPHLRPKVFGVIFIQSPFYGTFVADFFSSSNGLLEGENSREGDGQEREDGWDRFLLHTRLLPQSLKRRLYGIWQSTKSLTARRRQSWMKQNALAVQEIFESKPGVTLTTYDESRVSFRVFEIFRKLMQWKGIVSDGVVPHRSMQIPGVSRVSLVGLDHAAFVFRSKRSQLKQFQTCGRILSMLNR